MLGEASPADEAVELGLVLRVVPPHELSGPGRPGHTTAAAVVALGHQGPVASVHGLSVEKVISWKRASSRMLTDR